MTTIYCFIVAAVLAGVFAIIGAASFADGDLSALRYVASFGHSDILLSFAVPVSVLHVAAEKGDIAEVKCLIAGGADVNAKDKDGFTPLHRAASDGHAETTLALVNAGADIGAKDDMGFTPLHIAALFGQTKTVLALVKHGADIRAKTNGGETPLHKTTELGATETALALVKHGADIGAKTNDGLTPLHLAAMEGHTEIALALVNVGANIQATDKTGKMPVHVAAQHGKTETANALIEVAQADARKGGAGSRRAGMMCANHQAAEGFGLIYIATCKITEKSYVGQTTNTLEVRRAEHLEAAKNDSRKCPLFYDELRRFPHEKYWHWRVIHRCHWSELDDAERRFIAKLSRHPRGYNWNPGGEEYVELTSDDFLPPSGSLF